MGKLKTGSFAADIPADSSWSTNQQSKQLTDSVRNYLIQQHTKYVSHSVENYHHSTKQADELYDKVVTYIIGRQKQRPKIWYVCRPSNQNCTIVSIFDDYLLFDTHMKQQHQSDIKCLNCDRSIHPAQYNKHYSICCKSNDDKIVKARNKQITALNNEQTVDNDELDDDEDDVDLLDSVELENTLLNDLDDYIPVHRNRRDGTCEYYNPLIRIESLQYYDINSPVTVDDCQTIEFAEWTPNRCERNSESCNIVSHGTFLRFCYDADEPFLIEIKRYKCTKHFNITKNDKRSYITFNMLSECVDKQMLELQTIRKTQDIMVFDSVLITANLWTRIANISLITMNDSHCNTIIKHDYRRRWNRKYAMHMEYMKYRYMDASNHTCTALECYGLTMRKANEWLQLYSQITQRALDISVTRAIYHRNIVPQAVLQPANALQHKIITEHCTNAISMDHTFKMAKFGIYNILDDTKPERSTPISTQVHTTTNTTTAEPIASTDTAANSVLPNESPTTSTLHANKRKRKYNQSASYTKLTAQLLTVMDSNKLSLQCYVVPSGKTTLQARMLEYLVSNEMIDLYCRKNPGDIDDSNNVNYPVLRKPGVTALNNLIHDNNIRYIFDRTQSHCVDSTGTTANESFHRICNSKISQSGGIRTFASAQQNMLVIQYQYNTNKLYKKGRYWCDIYLPRVDSVRQKYCDPLGEPDKNVLQRLEIEWSNMRWTAEHDNALDQLIIDLGTGKEYCHTKRLHYWLSTQPGLSGIAPKIIEKKLNDKLAKLLKPTAANEASDVVTV